MKIDLNYLDYISLRGINDPNIDNALLVFQHDDVYHFYHVQFKTRELPGREMLVSPLELEIKSHEEKYLLPENIDVEIERITNNDETIGVGVLVETIPVRESLEYKLQLTAIFYLLAKQYKAV